MGSGEGFGLNDGVPGDKILKSRVISRYGILHMLVSDNEPQFAGKDPKWFLEELHIEHRFALMRHAQTNGHVKPVNKVVLDGLKNRVCAFDSNWVNE